MDTTEEEEQDGNEPKTGTKNEPCNDLKTMDLPESFKRQGVTCEWVQTSLGCHWPESPPALPPRTPQLLHSTTDELVATPGIEAETLPDVGLSESLSESPSISASRRSSPRRPRVPESGNSAQTSASHAGTKSKIPVNVLTKRETSSSRERQLVPSDTHLRGPGLCKMDTGPVKTHCQNPNQQQEQRTTGAKTRAQTKAAEVAQTR